MPSRRELANAIRVLAMDAVQRANCGHPGMPMGMADIAEVLWNDYLKFNPADPSWSDRDRFILSNGHGSMLQYALLHLSGFDLSIEELKNFRQLHSKTPGHPEYREVPGVEATTGPLGQGLANGVGMALAERMLAQQFNRPNFNLVDHYTYVFCGDGCLMEGISHEACSLAGTWGLAKLIVGYDDNGISIDGKVEAWFNEDTAKRFEAYNWQVIRDVDGHDTGAITAAFNAAKAETNKPTLIIFKTHIGYGSPNKVGTAGVHGAALGDEEIALTRKQLNWNHSPFEIPKDIYQTYDAKARGQQHQSEWNTLFAKYETEFPELAAEFLRRQGGFLPEDFAQQSEAFIQSTITSQEKIATRKASQQCLQAYGPLLPELVGGSADLTGSNNTNWDGSEAIGKNHFNGNYIYYGVREFGMAAIANGLALHGAFIPYFGTFLVFSDYACNAVRLSALMQIKTIAVFTHDSIALGEDGPTHQPVEQINSLRDIPGLDVWRPANLTEAAVAWQQAVKHAGPSALIATRQGLAPIKIHAADLIKRGGYIIYEPDTNPVALLIATGSEVSLALQTAELLKAENIAVRVVSMPCAEEFLRQDKSYQEKVLAPQLKIRLAIEMGSTSFWYRFVGDQGAVFGVDRFGISAPLKDLLAEFGFTAENMAAQLKKLLK
ncbi:MAG: transketolase [Gammaproteobacteria bacterium]|nr:transketolase [Gammaproteobacteria bacterium]